MNGNNIKVTLQAINSAILIGGALLCWILYCAGWYNGAIFTGYIIGLVTGLIFGVYGD